MNYSKIVGSLLLIGGVSVIVWTLMSSYNIFTAKAAVPEFFGMPQEKTSTQTGGTQDIQEQMQQMISEQLKGFLPANSIPQFLNLTVWSILAGLLIFGGTQIAGLGIKLMK